MKKVISKILAVFFSSALLITCLCNMPKTKSLVAEQYSIMGNEDEIYAKPTTSPNGKRFSIVNSLSFENGSYTWIENDDWDWDTYASQYAVTQVGTNKAFSFYPAGGGYNASFEAWIPPGDLNGTSGVSFFVDFSNLVDNRDIKVRLKINTSTIGNESDYSKLDKATMSKGYAYYFDYYLGEWVQQYSTDGKVSLPEGYKGYVYTPIVNYNGLSSNGVGVQGRYIQMYHLDMWIGENYECGNSVVLDSFDLLLEGEEHTHNYTGSKSITANCTACGVDLQTCSCGQVKWTNFVSAIGHKVQEKYYHTPTSSFGICEECSRLEYFNESSSNHIEDAIKVVYHYNKGDKETIVAEYPKYYTLLSNDILWKYKLEIGEDIYQFFRFTSDVDGIEGFNLLGQTLTADLEAYAQYNICSYDGEKFRAMYSDVSLNGGPYNVINNQGKIVFIGNSNFSLWHNMENWYKQKGLTVLNNSVAGASSYNYVEYIEELVLMYKPKIVVTVITSNDLSYHQMSDKVILGNMKSFYETIQKYLPNTQVVTMQCGSLPGRTEYFTMIKRLNAKYKEYCEQNDNAYFFEGDYNAEMEAVKQYPDGWDTWTHRNQAFCEQSLGTNLEPILRQIIQEKGIVFN